MKIAGFTFIRNAVKYDYPIVESITSILPICDEFVVALGNSDDATESLLKSISSTKIRIIHTEWDDSLREGGRVLAVETDKAFDAIGNDADWCFYIQGDEVVHEMYLETIKSAMIKYKDDISVDGLLLNYLHFYGSYDYVGDTRRWYRREIRVIKNDKSIRSFRDAQGFRKGKSKLKVKHIDAYVYHYGWVREPQKQQNKVVDFQKLWHDDKFINDKFPEKDQFIYELEVDSLKVFEGSHPKVMLARICNQSWSFNYHIDTKNVSLRVRFLRWIEDMTGIRIGEYKNYTIV